MIFIITLLGARLACLAAPLGIKIHLLHVKDTFKKFVVMENFIPIHTNQFKVELMQHKFLQNLNK